MIAVIKQWFNKRKMKKELEQQTVFGQVEKAGLNKEEIMFIYEHIKKYNDFNKAEIDKSDKMKILFQNLGSLGDLVSGNINGETSSGEGLQDKVNEMMKKSDEFTDKLKKEWELTDKIVKKLTPLKEIFE